MSVIKILGLLTTLALAGLVGAELPAELEQAPWWGVLIMVGIHTLRELLKELFYWRGKRSGRDVHTRLRRIEERLGIQPPDPGD